MERPPQLHNKLQARIRTRHWLSQEDDALVYAREVTWIAAESAATPTIVLHIGTFPLEECPHPKVLGVELIRSNLEILRRRHK